MRIGLAGVGRIGTMHANVLAGHDQVDELVLFDAVRERASELAASLQCEAVQTLDELFDGGVDGLVVATATGSHAELIRRGLTGGIPVFCEKPVALNVAETEDVLARVEQLGIAVQVGFHRRFDPGYANARAALAEGKLGELRRVHIVSADPAPPAASYIETSGGIFRDLHIHDFDILRWVTGREVVSVYATGANRGASFFGAAADVDECITQLVLDDDTLVTAQGSRYNGAGYDIRMELSGTEATHVVGLAEESPVRSAEPGVSFPSGSAWVSFSDRFRTAYVAEMDAFLDVVAGRRDSPCTVRDALIAFYVAEAASVSLREGRLVSVDEVTPAGKARV